VRGDCPRAQERQEHQRRQAHAHQHRKIAVDATGQVFANQAKEKAHRIVVIINSATMVVSLDKEQAL
jgi:hypothetical protein